MDLDAIRRLLPDRPEGELIRPANGRDPAVRRPGSIRLDPEQHSRGGPLIPPPLAGTQRVKFNSRGGSQPARRRRA